METLVVVAIVTLAVVMLAPRLQDDAEAHEESRQAMRDLSITDPVETVGGGCLNVLIAITVIVGVMFYISSAAVMTGLEDEWISLLYTLDDPLDWAVAAMGGMK